VTIINLAPREWHLLLQVIYAWARDAPKLELPEGVGFKVGGKSPIQYLILQVHYATVKPFEGANTQVFISH
jgi:peptidylglycine monooxygenase